MSENTGEKDLLLLHAFRKGEEKAFDQLFREYFAPLSYFAHGLIQQQADAEDIVQDCFIALWKRRQQLTHIESIKSYLYTSIRYQCLKYLRKKRKQLDNTSDLPTEPTVEALIISADTARQLYQLIQTLSPSLQDVIRLYYLEGKSNHEIAGILHIDPESVSRQRLRGLIALRKTKISLC